jgi:hypothetical protein
MLNHQEFWWESFVGGFSFGSTFLGIVQIITILACAAFASFDLRWESQAKIHFEKNVKVKICVAVIVLFSMLIGTSVEAYRKYSTIAATSNSPKLNGFIHRNLTANEPGTTNSFVFLDVSISNSGDVPSAAAEYELMLLLPKRSVKTNAEAVNFAKEYKLNFSHNGKPWLIDLKREQLISEKTTKAIPVGEYSRGWAAFRVRGLSVDQFLQTNLVLSFSDIDGDRVFVTNGLWKGKLGKAQPFDDLTTVIPGAENIFYPVAQPARTDWAPPELPPGCSNITVYFGAYGLAFPRQVAEISPAGKKFSVADLPDFLTRDLDKMPNYSPRQREIWIMSSGSEYTIGGRTVSYPIQPVVISNRLYVEVAIPFTSQRRRIIMSDTFSSELPIPLNWDVNFSTNYDAFGSGVYAYEMVNELTNPVLQVVYAAPNEVHVNGIFQVDSNSILAAFGELPRLGTFSITAHESDHGSVTASLEFDSFRETLVVGTNETIASFSHRLTNALFRPIFKYQRPMFKYPSNRNLGVFADSSPEP